MYYSTLSNYNGEWVLCAPGGRFCGNWIMFTWWRSWAAHTVFILKWFWPASSLICGNKMPTRCNKWLLLQILLLAQHVPGTIMPIIRSSRILYRWLLPVVFGALVFKLSVWCGAEGYVSGLQAATTCIILSSSWWWAYWCQKHVEQTIRSAIKNHLLHLIGNLFPYISQSL